VSKNGEPEVVEYHADEPVAVPESTKDTVTGPTETLTQDPSSGAVTKVVSYPQGWSLVERGSWQVSVAPDGLIMLPRHLHPSEAADFCAAVQAAAPVGAKQRAANDAKTTPPLTEEELLASPAAFVAETGTEPVPGATPMRVTPRTGLPRDRATIGRPKRQDVREPRVPQQPQPPNPGGRHGRQNQR